MATATETEVTPYQRCYNWARAHEMPEWGRADAGHWSRLEAIASEHQRGEYDWTRAVTLLAETVGDMLKADMDRAHVCQVCGVTGHRETRHGLPEPILAFEQGEDPRISAAEDARDFPEDNGREVW